MVFERCYDQQETLVYNNTPAIPIAYTGFFKDGSNVVFMPASNSVFCDIYSL